jgi:hypothetical protein
VAVRISNSASLINLVENIKNKRAL